jgi:hypothetical protein
MSHTEPANQRHACSVQPERQTTGAAKWSRWVLAAVLLLWGANSLQTFADPDLWGHLQFGLEHAASGQLARIDPYSYTAGGAEWTNHEWLTEWTFGVCYSQLGTAGLMLLRAALLASTLTAVGVICVRRRAPGWAILLLAMFGISVIAQFFRVRPQMYTYMLMAWLLVICDSHRLGKRWGLCLVPVLILAWTNLHAGFVAGLGIFGVFWLSFVIEAWRDSRRGRELAFLFAVLAAAFAVTLVNPYGLEYWRYVLFAITLPRPAITEWQPVFDHNGNLVAIYLAAAIIPAIAWLFSTRKGAWAETAVFALGAVIAGRHVRHVPFLMLFGSLVFLRRAPEAVAIWGPRLRRRIADWTEKNFPAESQGDAINWAGFGAFLLVFAAGVGGIWKAGHTLAAMPREGSLVVSAKDYPVQAVEFLRENGISGNLDCGFNWGEYCIFKLYPQCRVFCDGRYETVYPHEVSRLALSTEGEAAFRERLEDYPTEIVLAPLDDAFAQWAAAREDMVEIYRDATARILLRRTPGAEPLIDAWRQNRLKSISTSDAPRPFPA